MACAAKIRCKVAHSGIDAWSSMPAELMQCRLDIFAIAVSGLCLGRHRERSQPVSNPAAQDCREQIAFVAVTRVDRWLAYAGCLRHRVDRCAVKTSLHEQGRCNVE